MLNSLILKKCDGFYSIPLFENYNLRAVFTTRKYNMAFDSFCRKTAYKKMGVNGADIVCPSQVHRDSICVAKDEHKGSGNHERSTAIQDTDALITSVVRLPIVIQTADCLPVFIFDRRKKIIALVHSGWKSLHKNIIAKTVEKMRDEFSSENSDLIIAFGPAIRQCCYEVGEEFLGYFPKDVYKKNEKLYFDIVAAAIRQLSEAGILAGNIYDANICTSCANGDFFSYRKEGKTAGRSMSIMEIL